MNHKKVMSLIIPIFLGLALISVGVITIGAYMGLYDELVDIQAELAHVEEIRDHFEATTKSLSLKNNIMSGLCNAQTKTINELKSQPDTVNYIGTITTTAYTLSPAECSKTPTDYGYGLTINGTDLKNRSIHNSRYCGVTGPDLEVGNQYLIIIPEPYSYLSGIYSAVDTGPISENHVDLFFGESNVSEALDFGVRQCEVYKWNG